MEHGGSLQPQQGQWGCLEDTAVGSQPQLNLIGNGQKPFLGTLPRVDWVQLFQTRKVLKISEKEGKPGWGRAQCRRCCVWVCVCVHIHVCVPAKSVLGTFICITAMSIFLWRESAETCIALTLRRRHGIPPCFEFLGIWPCLHKMHEANHADFISECC